MRNTLRIAGLLAWTSVGALVAGATACGDDDGSFDIGKDLVVNVTPNPVGFSTVNVNAAEERVVTIRHAGSDGTLRLRSVTLSANTEELTITQPEVMTLAAGESTTMKVIYRPVDSLQDRGTIYIATNAAGSGGGELTVEVPIETLAQAARLTAIPNPVDFGDVAAGETSPKTVSVVNSGSGDVTVTGININAGGDGDFTIVNAPTVPFVVAPDTSFTVDMLYAPTGGGGDTGRLELLLDIDGQPRANDPPIALIGREVGPKLVAFPNPIDFGWRAIGVPANQTVTLANQGSRDLVIDSITLAEWGSGTVTVAGGEGGVTIPANDVLPLVVTFTPTSDMVQTTAPIDGIVIVSNDPLDGGEQILNVFGRAETPVLQVNPPESVDFAYVAQNLSTQRKVSLYNAGSAPLTVNSIALADNASGEFAIRADESWGPLSSSPQAGTLAPGEYREVKVVFTNQGADTGTEWGTLVIDSNDGQRPLWEVDLKALRAGAPTCEITLAPPQLDFGTVPRGHKKTLAANIVNTGSGDCSFHSAMVNDCASFIGFFGGSCSDPNNTIQQSGNSEVYSIKSTPPAIQGFLKPGQSYPVEITFTPPDTAPIFGDEFVDYGGFLGIRIVDPYAGTTTPFIHPGPTGANNTYTPNLHGKSGIANLAVLPAEVDFGLVTIGCHSKTFTVTAYNVGTAPLDLTNVELQGCSPEFRVKAAPGLPVTMQPNDALEFEVVYVPQDVGTDSCGLAFYTDSDTPIIVTPLDGGGTYDTEQTDEFVQTTGQDVDVLFVVDNSGSMGDEQNNLSSNFNAFISSAATWSNDYHVGVTTTDLEADAGRLKGSPRFVTIANPTAFANNVRVGSNGSGTEQGLAAAQQALSLPHTGNSTVACTADAQCTDPERCVDGFCGGSNRGFLRPEATLEIVFVSDEEDSSPGDIAFYVNFFKSIKGFYNDNLMHAHAIVGPAGGCSNSYGSASEGYRYAQVAAATGGTVSSVCDANFAAGLASIGDIAFGLRTQFFLSRLADPPTITVTIDGAGCMGSGGSNWRYDAPSNSVIFNENGGCMPQAGQTISIHYETLCLLE